jgi:hypothetical protein
MAIHMADTTILVVFKEYGSTKFGITPGGGAAIGVREGSIICVIDGFDPL